MKELALERNTDIDNEGAAMLLECLSNVEKLFLSYDNISSEMKDKLKERAEEVGCRVNV